MSSVFEDDFSPLLFITLTIKLLISFKCLKFPRKLFQKRKFPRCHPKNRKPHLSQVHVGSDLILQKKCLSGFEYDSSPLLFINLIIKLLISFKCLKLPRKLSQKRKFPRHQPKNRKTHLSQVHVDPQHSAEEMSLQFLRMILVQCSSLT